MAKSVKKKNRRLKRSVRKTFGALFLASALVVAAIPTEGLQAEDLGSVQSYTQDPRITISDDQIFINGSSGYIPKVEQNAKIYTTSDGMFQFAYVDSKTGLSTGSQMVAVILGYSNTGALEGGRLVIPDTVEAYLKYSYEGTDTGYAAVNQAGEHLYYMRYVDKVVDGEIQYEKALPGESQDEAGYKLDEDKNRIPIKEPAYYPCLAAEHATWSGDSDFYTRTGTGPENYAYVKTTTDRIAAAKVCYIGNQYLVAGSGDEAGTWKIADDFGVIKSDESGRNHGVFHGAGNIGSLTIGPNMMGIGNWAFSNCTAMSSITLANGLQCLGNHAFEDCVNLNTANIDPLAILTEIGSYCFYNCQSLMSFDMPISVSKIGDQAFSGCTALTDMNLINPRAVDEGGNQKIGVLSELGNGVFKNCSSLRNITFPSTFNNNGRNVDVSEFEGCTSLQYIKTDGNNNFTLIDTENKGFSFENFKATVPSTFYLEGPQDRALHHTATDQHIAFRFFDDLSQKYVYELVVEETDGGTVKYWVDDDNQLVKCEMNPETMTTVTLPETIGPKHISTIGTAFQHKCFLKTITIPASVSAIANDAFRGCHNLLDVIFTQAENITSIGAGAFSTQETDDIHNSACDKQQDLESELRFTGTISTGSGVTRPFDYAMNPSEYINAGSQYRTYITYYSGWPTNLAVRYNDYTGLNELIDYPTLEELKEGTKYVKRDYGSNKGYAYMTDEYISAAAGAVKKYTSGEGLTDYEKQIINAALAIHLPEGIESIAYVNSDTGELVGEADPLNDERAGDTIKGLFSYKEAQGDNDEVVSGGHLSKTLTADSLQMVGKSAFKDCSTFNTVELNGPLNAIGSYAFEGCENLSGVSLSESISQMGLRPFTGCTGLSNVNFNGSERFSCEDSLIFEYADGEKKLVEYLCGKTFSGVEADDVIGVTEVYPEAFMETGVTAVDLSQSSIKSVPESAFRETSKLYSVTLPNTCGSISADAFTDSGITQLTIPGSVTFIHNDAFRNVEGGEYSGMTNLGQLYFVCPEGSAAEIYADQNGIAHRTLVEPVYHKVMFYDWDGTLLETQDQVLDGTAAIISEEPVREGYVFTGWIPSVDCVTADTTTTAQYGLIDTTITITFWDWTDPETKEFDTILRQDEIPAGGSVAAPQDPYHEGYVFTGWLNGNADETKEGYLGPFDKDTDLYARYETIDSSDRQHLVQFFDWDETLLSFQRVVDGEDAIIPRDPEREGWTFTGWRPAPTNVTKDLDVWAQYTPKNSGATGDVSGGNTDDGSGGGTGDGSGSGTGDGSGGGTGDGSGGGTGDGSGGGTGDGSGGGTGDGSGGGTTSQMYTLTVQNGSGSGSYVAGSQPIIIANDPSSTQQFSHWTIDPENTTIASKVLSATVITMPENNVTVTAHYTARTGSWTGSGNSSSVNSVRPNNGARRVGGTTVVIDKNGLSNTGVVSATVNGSSDNFVIKITESSEATEAAVNALMAEYGSLDNIKYFPMDISLYDSTGTNKITDTTGLSVSITLPLPDSMITYAGNNKVAGVVNGKLDKLTPKFTTISGVSCMTFTAEHFSPYVIYVDTAHLSAGTSSDATPKTGDGIHPKWFLSIGLACLSFVMFMQKDRKKPQKVKVKAKP